MKTFSEEKLEKEDIDVLLHRYFSLKEKESTIKLELDLIKKAMQNKLDEKGVDKIDSELGRVSMIRQKRRYFIKSKAQQFLTNEEKEQCYREGNVEYVRVFTPEELGRFD